MKTPKRKRSTAVTATAADAVLVENAAATAVPCESVARGVTSEVAQPAPVAAAVCGSVQVSTAPADWPPDPIVALPSNATVRDAAALKVELMKVLELPAVVALDVRSIERVDTATLQLLCAFVRDRAKANLGVQWHGSPPALIEAARSLGVLSILALPDAGAV